MKRIIAIVITIILGVGIFTKVTLNMLLDDGACLDSTCLYTSYTVDEVELELKGYESVSIDFGSEYLDAGVKAVYREIDISRHMQVRTNLDIYTAGTYTYEYYIVIGDNEYSIEREVKVLKDYGVDFSLLGSKKLSLDYGSVYEEAGAIAFDKKNGSNISHLIKVKNEIDTRVTGSQFIYYHFYYNGQKHFLTREVVINEYDSYSFELNNGEVETITMFDSITYNVEDGAAAYDYLDLKNISGFITIVTDFEPFEMGEYIINYTLSYNGINVTLTKTLKVVDSL